MRDEHQRRAAFAVELEQQFNDVCAGLAVEIAGGFIGKQQFGVTGEGAGNCNALLFSAGKLARVMPQTLR